jgi:Carboxypeptidase regulatory-like domain/TonB dependent receptor
MSLMKNRRAVCLLVGVIAYMLGLCGSVSAQTTLANVTGRVVDPNAAVIVEATVTAKNVDTGIETTAQTNEDGIYHFATLEPGNYEFSVFKRGFKVIVKPGVALHVADTISMNFNMQVGDVRETITVEAGAPMVNTTDASVSTVVDRQFAENLPMNGRSFQTLIQLTPGVVVVPSNPYDNGQFSVNGQRASSNYWMVDGVSANTGVSAAGGYQVGNGPAGATASFSTLGGTNGLVSIDAMQEFRIQTSTYAPEFGRTPGAQVSILTRSGTNQFHGTVFEYFRNDVLDANDWFNSAVIPPLAKAKERQNDFGGTFSGPILQNRTFFFFSYEGLRLRLPTTKLTTVPDTDPADPYSRQFATPAIQPYLNAFPLPNGPEVLDSDGNHQGIAQFNASFSNPASLEAYSLRIDHRINDKLTLFGRYSYSPSSLVVRGGLGSTLSIVQPTSISNQTGTAGATGIFSPSVTNDLRFNYTRTESSSRFSPDNLGGAVPLSSLPLASPFTSRDGFFGLFIFSLPDALQVGQLGHVLQRQINVIDSLSVQRGSHSLKFGADFRQLTPLSAPKQYGLFALFLNVPAVDNGNLLLGLAQNLPPVTFLFRNLGVYAQDTWRIWPRLTMTYGARWDVDFVLRSLDGPNYSAVTNYNLGDLSNLALARAGMPPYQTGYGNVAPRLGIAYQISQSQNWQSVLRGGFGVFYDLASSGVGSVFSANYPFGSSLRVRGTFPFPSPPDPASITPASLASGFLVAIDPNLKQPYTLEWNIGIEQALGEQQTISASYIGAEGRQLLQSFAQLAPLNQNIGGVFSITNRGTSDYNALQIKFQRRMSRGIQALASYTMSHSIDTASAGSLNNVSDLLVPGSNPKVNRGPSDFDVRNAFSAGLTYDIPAPKISAFANAILRGWSVENFVLARSAPPVDVTDANFGRFNNGISADTRPDLVEGQSLYVYGSQYPGGRAFNPNAFIDPPTDPNTGNPARQGNLGRNALRGFGAAQWDFAIHRDFVIRESAKFQFRAEMFNVLNHPNFGPPSGQFGAVGFGVSNQMLGQSLNGGNLGGGALSPLYQIGGPRSIQFALKLNF